MNQTIFTEHSDQNKWVVTRMFNAPRTLVWKAWTDPELLDRWWAPSPWKSSTKHADFREGGSRLYAMIEPDGVEHFAITKYLKIVEEQYFNTQAAFCDEQGAVLPGMPNFLRDIEFRAAGTRTEVTVTHTFTSPEAIKQYIEMGAQEGTLAVFEGLDVLLAKLEK